MPPVAVRAPVDGLKLSLVEVTFAGKFPVLAVTHTGYIVALVVSSFVMPMLTAFVAVPTVTLLGVVHCGADPVEVRIVVDAPIASLVKDVPVEKYTRSPAVYEVNPVPPLAKTTGVVRLNCVPVRVRPVPAE